MRKALIVGINDYPDAPLTGCVNDANSIASVLESHSDGSPNFSVKSMTSPSEKIERSTLREEIDNLFKGQSDIALLYFSGHGFIKGTGGYIVTQDFKRYDEGISMDDILSIANNSQAKEKIIIFDCCYSGAMGDPVISGQKTSQLSEGLTILTASSDSEASFEINGSGVFTSLLVDALQGGAGDLRGKITPGSVYAYVDQALGPWEQRPIFKTNVSSFTSLRSVDPPVSLSTLRKICDYFSMPQDYHPLDPSYEFSHDNAKEENVSIFKDLQKFESVGLVVPNDEEHMYFAAINSKSCRLTALGAHYWRLVNEKKL